MQKETHISSAKTLTKSRLFRVESVHICYKNGEERDYERVVGRSKASVLIVPLLDPETVLLIREFGAGIGEYTLGFPKGAVEEGEDLLVSANRELMEEVGYGANQLRLIKQVSTSPSYQADRMEVVLAEDLYPKRVAGDEPEELEVVPWSLKQVDELLSRPDFNEARSIAALLMLERMQRDH